MRNRIFGLIAIAALAVSHDVPRGGLTITHNPQKRNSNKSKLKSSKPKAHAKYKSSKPLKSKAVPQFRNKSNI
jgi:hypothetical protein